MSTVISIQPAQFTYNVWVGRAGDIVEGKKSPYPFHVDAATGDVRDQDFWKGDPYRVVGFQNDVGVQRVDLWWEQAARNPDSIVGKFPVMLEKGIGLYTYVLPIESVITNEVAAEESGR